MKAAKRNLLLALLCIALVSGAEAIDVGRYPVIQELIEDLSTQHGYPREEIASLFARVQLLPSVVDAIQKPYEALPWHRYRKLFLTDDHINNGVEFWKLNAATLARAEQKFGIPPHIIVAIIGVETRFGKRLGKHPVLDSLTTLVIQYPRRRTFFRRELEQFLLLTREEGLDPLKIKGSYAGAIGVPQFISSSYRQYAVDFNGDNRRDLIGQTEDAIGSVANYLYRHRWQSGQPIVSKATVEQVKRPERFVSEKLKPNSTLARLKKAGVGAPISLNGASRASLLRLDGANRAEYRIAFDNFYVITKYNRSIHYAMAVFELSEEIRKKQATG